MKRAAAGAALRPMTVPQPKTYTLPNGLTVHVVPRGPMPLVSVRLLIDAGSAFDAPGSKGVADFAARMLRRGAGGLSADALSDAVDFVAGTLGGFATDETLVVTMNAPTRALPEMLELMATITLRPDFPPSEVELMRRRTLAQIANALDDPGELAERALMRAIWGDHPYGYESEGRKVDIEKISREQLIAFHRERMGPRVANLYVVGDVDETQLRALIEKNFGGWSGGPAEAPVLPPFTGLARPGEVIVVDKPEQTQVQMRIGAVGVRRGHHDHCAIMAMNTVLGDGFTSRLVREIRVKRGLSYGAGSGFQMAKVGGSFVVRSFTKTENINTLIDVSLAEVRKMRLKGPTSRELANAQRYIVGLYPARLESNDAIAGTIADIVHYRLPPDHISTYRQRMMAVTLKVATAAAAQHLFDDRFTLVLVGNAAQLETKVKKYGRVSVLTQSDLE